MSKVSVTKDKLDILANAIANKSGEPLTLTLDEMVSAVDGIDTSGITPSGNIDITQTGVTDVTNYATVTVNEISPQYTNIGYSKYYTTQGGQRKWIVTPVFENTGDDGAMVGGHAMYQGESTTYNAIPTGTTITPTTSSQTLGGANYMMEGAVTVNAVPTATVTSSVTPDSLSADASFNSETGEFTAMAYIDDSIHPISSAGYTSTSTQIDIVGEASDSYQLPTQSATTITPTESSQTAVTAGKYTTGAVTVSAIPSNYVGSGITQRSSSDLTVSGATVTAPSGYYSASASKSVASGSVNNVSWTKTRPAGTNKLRITHNLSKTAGYITAGEISSYSDLTLETKTVTPTTSSQTITPTSDYYYLDSVTVEAMPSGTEGTPIATKGTVSNHSVSVTPSVTNTNGFISGGTKTGTAVTVSASELVSGSETKTENGTYDVTNLASLVVNVPIPVETHTITITGAGDSTSGYVRYDNVNYYLLGDTIEVDDGSIVYISISYGGDRNELYINDELVAGGRYQAVNNYQYTVTEDAEIRFSIGRSASYGYVTELSDIAPLTVTQNGTYTASGSTRGYSPVTVSVSGGSPSLQTKTKTYTPTTSQQTESVSADSGYDGLDIVNITVNAMPTGTATAPTSISGTSATVSTGTNTLTLSKTVSVTPRITTAGYVASGTAGNSAVSLTANVTTKGTATITPTTSNQTIASGTYLTGTQTISGDANLVAGNIKSGTTIFGVTGTYSGGGGSLTVATKTLTHTATSQTLSFSSLSGQPKYWFLRTTTNVSSSGSTTYYYVTDCFYDGTSIKGNTFRIGSTRRVQNITSGITQSYSGGTLTITAGSSSGATPGQFYGASNFGYELVYIY